MDPASEIHDYGYCVLKRQFDPAVVESCRHAFWPVVSAYIGTHGDEPNRGPNRHFLPMPFERPCFDPAFFFDDDVLAVVRAVMDDRVVADQWGCDVPLFGSVHQDFHIDYQRPLFAEAPDLQLPAYMLVVSFGLVPITQQNGPLEIVPGSHWLRRAEALRAMEASDLETRAVHLDIGDVLIRNPWMLHRGTPNTTNVPRPLVSIRYVRQWYTDNSRDVNCIPRSTWESLSTEQQRMMRFPIGD